MTFNITITETGEEYACRDSQHLLAGMVQLGKKGIPVGCRSGGCGVCKIKVVSGQFNKKKMSRDHITEQEEANGIVLACRVFPESDIQVDVIGKLQKTVTKSSVTPKKLGDMT